MNIPNKSINRFTIQLKGAAICINAALSELVDWPISEKAELQDYLQRSHDSLVLIANTFEKTAHGGGK